ncbi:MAG: baseplate J/gp47 family protein [Candidatus Binatus sp.]|uniref:baseplate assembly protein n=1 Tax=Candidatus Binatus sp. TaxID=2811406 RepID=UPI003BB0450B
MGAGILSLPPPVFVNDADGLDPNLILADMIAEFEAAAERTLQPAQVERLLINLYAYRESLVRNAIQYAAEQNLLAFASFPMLDYLGQLLSVTRLASQPAVTTLQFTLTGALTVPFTIPAGTQAGTSDGQFAFATTATIVLAAGATIASVAAAATAPGAGANGYLAGQVNVLLNPNALIASVTNTSTTTGGSAPETDDHLRTRIQAAPNQFSVAGPIGAYRFFAIGADPSIVDAQVVSPAPGSVNVYVLTGPVTQQPSPAPNTVGVANSALLAKVAAELNADTMRPLTDTVNVLAVTEVDYQVTATVTLYSDADPTATITAATTAVQELALELAAKIQRDIVPSQIIAALSVAGVYGVALSSPTLTPLTAGQWANCTMISLTASFSTEHS